MTIFQTQKDHHGFSTFGYWVASPNQSAALKKTTGGKTMKIKKLLITATVAATFIASVAPVSASAILPKNFKIVDLSTGWIKGSNREVQCAGLMARSYPNRPFDIISTHESQRFEGAFRTKSRYKYYCKLLVKVSD